jgi:hypothetical protein
MPTFVLGRCRNELEFIRCCPILLIALSASLAFGQATKSPAQTVYPWHLVKNHSFLSQKRLECGICGPTLNIKSFPAAVTTFISTSPFIWPP